MDGYVPRVNRLMERLNSSVNIKIEKDYGASQYLLVMVQEVS